MAKTSLQERVMIQEWAAQGMTDRRIGQQLGLSPYTVRKWRRKAQRQGRLGLESHMGRPTSGAMSTFPPRVQEQVRAWREQHPGWGPKTLVTELTLREDLSQGPCPSRATIARWLKQEQKTRPYEKHQDLPQSPAAPVRACHDEWELDARGHEFIPTVGVISLINLNDVFSKAKLISYPCWLGEKRASRHATTEDYQLVLRLAFTEWGLPQQLAIDHESIFFDNASPSPYPTRLHLWLMALGVEVIFGRMRRPTDQAMTERSHQTWDRQVLAGQTFAEWESLWHALTTRRDFLNYHLPCATLGEVPPLVAHPEALLPRRQYRPEWEAECLDLARVYAYLSRGRWFRKCSNIGAISLGGHVHVLGRAWRRREVEVTFDPSDRHFVCATPDGEVKRVAAKGLTVPELMGEMGAIAHLKAFQLILPFSPKEWLQMYSCRLLSGTT
jgi:transposase